MARVFLSYAREDQERATALATALESAGHQVWWDRRLTGGTEFEREIEKALADAEVVVVAWSASSSKSHWVRDEAAAGRDSDRLLPVTLDGALPPLGFRQFHTIDLSNWGGGECPEVDSAVAAKAGEEEPGETIATPASRRSPTKKRRLLPIWAWSALAAFAILAAFGSWWLTRPASTALTLALGRFEVIGAGVEPGFAAGVEQELRTAFGDLRAPLATGGADFNLTGTTRRVGNALRLVVRLDDVAAATTIWTGSGEVAAGNTEALSEHLRQIAATVNCGLRGARDHRRRLESAALTLYFRYCRDLFGREGIGRQLDAARAVTAAAPDFIGGWLALATSAYEHTYWLPSAENRALQEEGLAAARRAIALAPDVADGYTWLAVLIPHEQAVEREASLRRATALRSFSCACAHQFLGDFLLQAGRTEEALAAYRRGVDQGSVSPAPLDLWRLFMGYHLTGRRELADQAMQRLGTLYPGLPVLGRFRRSAAAWNGRWAEAAEALRLEFAQEQAALRDAYLALESGDAGRIAAAGAAVEALPVARQRTETLRVPALALLGRTDAAFAAIETSLRERGQYAAPGRYPGVPQPMLWDPDMRALWTDPRFPSFLQRAGFIAYWRETRTRPDICRATGAPAFCRLLR